MKRKPQVKPPRRQTRRLDVIIRGGKVVTTQEPSTPEGFALADLGIAEGKIVALEPELGESANEIIDAKGLHIFPGLIDSHVHFNEPGRTDWEGIETGSSALAAGGGTMFFDMPLNSSPPVINVAAFDQKVAAARTSSLTDFAIWGGIVPGNLDELKALHERGVIGFKVFVCNSGIDDFPFVDEDTLHEAMKRVADLGSIVAVHAETESLVHALTDQALRAGGTEIADYLESRPLEAELWAIALVEEAARATKCPAHIVHVSSGAAAAFIAQIAESIDITCETCPHYLTLSEDDLPKLGAIAKCAPPLRTPWEQHKLWEQLLAGKITTIGSDHSPAPPHMKADSNFFKIWGGISGIQHTLPLLITEGHKKFSMPLPLLARVCSSNVAARFRLPPEKGKIAIGSDADLALIDLNQSYEVTREGLLDRHRQSPYVGRTLTGKVRRTILRGQTIFQDGKITAKPAGQLLKPVGRK